MDIALRGFCNADWAGDANNRQCTTCTCFLLALELFRGNATNHCIVYDKSGVYGH